MKKLLLFLGLLFTGSFLKAAPVNYEMSTVRYNVSIAASVSSTNSVIISLSSGTPGSFYPHRYAREIQVRGVEIEVDKLAASTCTVKLGVFSFVDVSSASISYFTGISNTNNVSNTNLSHIEFLDNLTYNLHVDPIVSLTNQAGKTPYLATNDTLSLSTTMNNQTVMPSTNGSIKPGPGDLVLTVQNGTGAIVVNVTVMYYGSN